ncbi:MAG: 2-oxo acid dehydrogenase subunit E2 [Clostridia bacterium]
MKRREAFRIKTVDPTFSLIMSIMPRRYDATNYSMIDIPCEGMDKFIAKKREETGEKYSYMHIIIASLVRTLAIRPHFNRFVMNARLYERYGVTVCFTIKQVLRDDAEEITIKHTFCGHETIQEIKNTLDHLIDSNLNQTSVSSTTKTARTVGGLPIWLSKMVVNFLRITDKNNCMPKKFLDISPFHTSFFITNLKSIKMSTIFHHCYDFGTTGLFVAMGKEKMEPVVNELNQVVPKKIIKLGFSCDERICDGHYSGGSFQVLKRNMLFPENLETEYHDQKVDAEIARQAKQKAIDQAIKLKQQAKQSKKQIKK